MLRSDLSLLCEQRAGRGYSGGYRALPDVDGCRMGSIGEVPEKRLELILQKIDIVKKYMKENYNIDIDELREIIKSPR